MKKFLTILLIIDLFIFSCKKNSPAPNQSSQNSINKKWYLFEKSVAVNQNAPSIPPNSYPYDYSTFDDKVFTDTNFYVKFNGDKTCIGNVYQFIYGINYTYTISKNNLFLSQNNLTQIDTILVSTQTNLTIKNTVIDTFKTIIPLEIRKQVTIYYFVSDKSLL